MDPIILTNVDTTLFVNDANIIPVATISCYAGINAPQGWLFCNGQQIDRSVYRRLFDAIGTTYGSGNGTTTFHLPNLQNRFPMGKGSNNLGVTGGSNTVTLTSDKLPSHSHTASSASAGDHSHTGTTNTTGSHTHSYLDAYFAENRGGGTNIYGTSSSTDYDNDYIYRPGAVTNANGDHSHTLTTSTEGAHTHSITVNATGTSNPTIDVTNTFITLNYIIRF